MATKLRAARSRLTLSLAAAAAAAGLVRSASVARGDSTWNTTTGDYNVAGNWNPTVVPNGGNATVDNGGTVQIQINDAPSFTPRAFIVGDGTGNGSVSQTGGTLSLVGNSTTFSSLRLDTISDTAGTSTGTYTLSGGVVTVGNNTTDGNATGLSNTGDVNIGEGNGTAILNISGGLFNDIMGGQNGASPPINSLILVGGGNPLAATSSSNSASGGGHGTGIINLSGGILASWDTMNLGNGVGSRGIVNITGGTLAPGWLRIGGANASGAVFNSGGNVIITNALNDPTGFDVAAGAGGYGYYNQSGGVTNILQQALINGGGTAVVDISGGSLFNGSNGSNGFFSVGRAATGGNASINISGNANFYNATASTLSSGQTFVNGTLRLNNTTGVSNFNVINVLGGTLGGTGSAAGFVDLDFTNAGANNTSIFNLDGGVVQATNIQATKATDAGTLVQVNFNGGTLRALTGNSTFISTSAGGNSSSGIYVYSNGGTIDTNGQNITITQGMLTPNNNQGITSVPLSGNGTGYIGAPMVKITGGGGAGATAIASIVSDGSGNGTFMVGNITITNPGFGYTGTPTITLIGGGAATAATVNTGGVTLGSNTSGGLTVIGNGTLTLTGASTYTGNTTVNFGTLVLGAGGSAGSLSTSSSLVLGGGAFAGNTTTSQTLNGLYVVAGASNVNSTNASNILVLGNITRTIGATVNFGNSTAQTAPTGTITTTAINDNGGILGGYATFAGNTWAVGSTAGSPTTISGFASYTPISGGPSATSEVDMTTSGSLSSQTVDSVRFNNAAPNTLTLTGTNILSSGGILVTSNVAANVSTITGGNLTAGSGQDLIVNQYNTSGNLTIASAITDNSGTGLTISGPGQVVLTGTNTYTSSTVINNGSSLVITSDAQLGTAPASPATNLVLNGGELSSTSSPTLNGNRNISLGINGGYFLVPGGTITINGNVTGSGALNAVAGSSRSIVILASSGNTYTGNTNIGVSGPGSGSNGANLQLGATNALPYGSTAGNVNITGNASSTNTLDLGGFSAQINGLNTVSTTGAAYTTATTNAVVDNATSAGGLTPTLTVGNGNITSAFYGVIKNTTGSLALTKVGTGSLTLGGANTYAGATTVNGGTLLLSTSTTNNIGSSTAIVTATGGTLDVTGVTGSGGFALGSGQVLGGTGTVNGPLTVASGSILSAGTSTALGTGSGNTTGTLSTQNVSQTTGLVSTAVGQTWNVGGNYTVKINETNGGPSSNPSGSGTAGGSTGWDLVAMNALTLSPNLGNGTAGNTFGVTLSSPGGAISDFSPTSNYVWPIATIGSGTPVAGVSVGNPVLLASTDANGNSTGTTGSSKFTLNTSSFVTSQGSAGDGMFALEAFANGNGESLDIVYNGTPEPGTIVLALVGAGPMLLARRRRKNRDSRQNL